MTFKRFALCAATLALGFAIVGLLYWALLNVPESNVAALALSGTLALMIVAATGVVIGAAMAMAQDVTAGQTLHRAFRALPAFLAGILLFVALWWITGAADAWWSAHAGEVDALFLRYSGSTRTRWLHVAVSWTTFLIRWAFGASLVLGLVAASASGGGASLRRGLRTAVRVVPLAAVAAAVVILAEGLWRAAYWRPRTLTTSLEPSFAAAKIVVLYLLASAIGATVVAIYRRSARPAATT